MKLSEQEKEPQAQSNYEVLRSGLFGGSLSFDEVRQRLYEFDQATPTRDASEDNLKFLYDSEVVKFVHDHPETLQGYKSTLSFTEFHVAQRMAWAGSEDAAEHFKKALENTDSNSSWAAYIAGTLLYAEGKEIPEDLIMKADKGRNREILRNFNEGLKLRGVQNYQEDYSK